MVRDFKESDLDQVIQIWLKASVIAHDFIPSSYWQEKKDDMKNIYIPSSQTFVYEDGEMVVGFISMLDNYIAAIFVLPEYQGKGIGTRLIDHVKKLYPILTLGVYSKNIQSIEFYKKHGFVVENETVEENTGEMETSMRYS